MAEMRRDPITGRRVIIAPGRAVRPNFSEAAEKREASGDCPFCTGNESMTPPEVWADRESDSLADTPGWRVRVVSNKYPALEERPAEPARGSRLDEASPAIGVHEVIIDSPAHDTHMSALGAAQCAAVLRAYRARCEALTADPRWRYFLIYKNQGERAGATLAHVHSQLIALPQVPPRAAKELDGTRSRFALAGRCIFCAVVERERQERARLVLESERFVAFCPFAARFAYETWILPKFHAAHFATTSETDLEEFGAIMSRVIAKLGSLAAEVPFNLLLHTGPLRESADEFYHWRMEFLPQLQRAAGFEWGTGMHMNPVAPEDAARLLRGAAD